MALDEKKGYDEMVSLIAGIEKEEAQRGQQVYTIDIRGMFGAADSGERQDYGKAVHTVNEVEALQQEMERRARSGGGGMQIPRRSYVEMQEDGGAQGGKAPIQPQAAGMVAGKEYSGMKTAVSGLERRTISQIGEIYREAEDMEKKAAEELSNAIGKIESTAKTGIRAREKQEEREEAVLPTLPIADQISELEKIAEGLDSNSFDHEQLDVIKGELGSLKQSVSAEKPANENGLERSMRVLRNSRMDYVLALLKGV
jgi:hypothetical protein